VPVALVGEEVIVEPDAVETGALRGEGGVAKLRPVGSLDPEGRTESHLASALVLAVAARAALNRFDLDLARLHLGEAQRLRPR